MGGYWGLEASGDMCLMPMWSRAWRGGGRHRVRALVA